MRPELIDSSVHLVRQTGLSELTLCLRELHYDCGRPVLVAELGMRNDFQSLQSKHF